MGEDSERGAERSISDQEDSLKRKLKAPTNIKCFKEVLDGGKIIRTAVCVTYRDRKIENPMHHARLENIFQELVVRHCPPSLNFKHPSLVGGVGISIEALLFLTSVSKKHRDFNLFIRRLSFFDTKTNFF